MKRLTLPFLVALGISGIHMSYAGNPQWPPLPAKAFISGRAANEQDIKDGNAIFVAKIGGTIIGKPLPVTVPQYAYWTDGSGEKVPVIIVQAEEAIGMQLFGFRDASGADYAATGPEIELLGTRIPN
jgi:hypothetical protein